MSHEHDVLWLQNEKMETFIENLLTYSRLNRPDTLFQPVDLRDILSDAIENLSLDIETSNAMLILDEMGVIEGNAKQLTQVFQNLIGNAIKFCREGEKPIVKVSGNRVSDDCYEIQVADNGIGILQEDLDRIFKPFERLQSASAFEGTGLGLAIVQKIIGRHKGVIKASSACGPSASNPGTVFTIQLPVRQYAVQAMTVA